MADYHYFAMNTAGAQGRTVDKQRHAMWIVDNYRASGVSFRDLMAAGPEHVMQLYRHLQGSDRFV